MSGSFYARAVAAMLPSAPPEEMIKRSRDLLILAEIVTRWPALQRDLHRATGGRRGLQLLAASVHDDGRWQAARATLALTDPSTDRPLVALRALLRAYDGPAVADRAALLT